MSQLSALLGCEPVNRNPLCMDYSINIGIVDKSFDPPLGAAKPRGCDHGVRKARSPTPGLGPKTCSVCHCLSIDNTHADIEQAPAYLTISP